MLRQVTTGLRVKGLGLRRDLLFCVLSGILLALPFSKINLWIFGWFGFVPLFFVLQNKSRFQAFLFSYLTGVIFWLITVYWLVHVTLAGMILMSLYLALYFGIFGLLIAYTPYPLPLTPCIYVSSIWVLLEYIRSYLMTGFPWALLGYSQSSNLPIIQIADITGVWGVSFVVMMVNVALYQGTRYKVQGTGIVKKYWLPIVFLAGVLVYGYCSINCYSRAPLKPLKKIKVSVAQGNIPQELKWDPNAKDYIIDKYLDIAKAAAKKDPDLIIMPEATMPVVLEQSPDVLDKVTNTVKENNIPLLFGTVTLNHGNFYNSALLISPKTGFIQQYNKLHLVPFGEFIPLRNTLTFLENMIPIGDFSAGKNYTIFKLKDARFSVLICFEDMFPEVSRGFVNAGTGFLVNMTNDAWFKDTSSPFQHLQGSIFRAVENRRFLVRSANTGVSAFIDRSGKVYSTLSDVRGRKTFISGFQMADVYSIISGRTMFTRFGNYFIFICIIGFIYGLLVLTKKKK